MNNDNNLGMVKIPNTSPFTLRLTQLQLNRLESLAAQEEITKAEMIRLALKRFEESGKA